MSAFAILLRNNKLRNKIIITFRAGVIKRKLISLTIRRITE